MKAPAGSTTVTPLTTLMQELIDANVDGVRTALAIIANKLGLTLTAGTDLTTCDPVENAGTAQGKDIIAAGLKVISTIEMMSKSITGRAGSGSAETANALMKALAAQLPGQTNGSANFANNTQLAAIFNAINTYPSGVSASNFTNQIAQIGGLIQQANSYFTSNTGSLDALARGAYVSMGEGASRLYQAGQGNDFSTASSGFNFISKASGETAISFVQSANTIVGTTAANSLSGTAGRDIIDGGAGNDTIAAGDGNDVTFGGAGNDILQGGAGNDIIYGDAGNDTLTGGAGIDRLEGDAGDDTFVVDAETGVTDLVFGGAGSDTLDFSNAVNTVTAGLGTDTYMGSISGLSNVTFSSIENLKGALNVSNVLTGNAGANVLTGGNMYDTLSGGAGNDTLYGLDAEDILLGGDGIDTLYGGAGDDSLTGGAGNDVLDGGTGTDYAIYSGKIADYTITNVSTGVFTVTHNTTNETDTLTNIETVQFSDGTKNLQTVTETNGFGDVDGSDFGDTITMTNDGTARGFGGPDRLSVSAAPDDVTLEGGTGNDVLEVDHGNSGTVVARFSGDIGDFDIQSDNADVIAPFSNAQTILDAAKVTVLGASGTGTTSGLLYNANQIAVVNSADPFVDANSSAFIISASTTIATQISLLNTLIGASQVSTTVAIQFRDILTSIQTTMETARTQAVAAYAGVPTVDAIAFPERAETQSIVAANATSYLSGSFPTISAFNAATSSHDGERAHISGAMSYDHHFLSATDTNTADGDEGTDRLTDITTFEFEGGIKRDFTAATLEGNGTINAGAETVILGGSGNDIITGDADAEVISGGAGNDTINGGDGNDQISGGQGNDMVSGGAGNDLLVGSAGDDTLQGGDGSDTLVGGTGTDTAAFDSDINNYNFTASFDDNGDLSSLTVGHYPGGAQTSVGAEGEDVLTGIEALEFSDASVDLTNIEATGTAGDDLLWRCRL